MHYVICYTQRTAWHGKLSCKFSMLVQRIGPSNMDFGSNEELLKPPPASLGHRSLVQQPRLKRLSGWIIGSPEKLTSQIQGPNVLIDTWANFKYNRRKSRPSVKMDLDSSSVLSSVVLQNPHGVLHTQSACFGHITSYRVPSSRHISCTMYTSCTIQSPQHIFHTRDVIIPGKYQKPSRFLNLQDPAGQTKPQSCSKWAWSLRLLVVRGWCGFPLLRTIKAPLVFGC